MRQATAEDTLQRLVREHDALRRVATVVARGPSMTEAFETVTRETGLLLGARMTGLLRIESPGSAVMVAGWSRDAQRPPVGSRGVLDGRGLVGRLVTTGRPVRLEDYDEVGGHVAEQMRALESARPLPDRSCSADASGERFQQRGQGMCRCPKAPRTGSPSSPSWSPTPIENAEMRAELAASPTRLVEAAGARRSLADA